MNHISMLDCKQSYNKYDKERIILDGLKLATEQDRSHCDHTIAS